MKKTDHILIFFTQNAKKLDMREIADHGEAAVKMIEIPAGKQSVDIHIGSFVGYLSAKYKGKDCRIAVISSDTDFDNVLQFWETNTGIRACRMPSISEEPVEKKTSKTRKTARKKAETASAEPDADVQKAFRAVLRNALAQAGFEQSVCDSASALTVQYVGSASLTEQVHNALQAKYKEQCKPIYKAIKPVLTEYQKTQTVSAAPKAEKPAPAPKPKKTPSAPKNKTAAPAPKSEKPAPLPKSEKPAPTPKVETVFSAKKAETPAPTPKVETVFSALKANTQNTARTQAQPTDAKAAPEKPKNTNSVSGSGQKKGLKLYNAIRNRIR